MTQRMQAIDVSVMRGEHTVLQNISLALHAGELVGLIGPNGAGKSTLLAALAHLLPIASGSITVNNSTLAAMNRQERARTIGWFEQLPTVHWPVSVERLVLLGRLPWLHAWQQPSAADHAAVTEALRATDCLPLRERLATTLSGGERTRALLARVLASHPAILLADEPIAALDLKHQLHTMAVLKKVCDAGCAGLVVMHDLSLAARYCDRLVLLNAGHHVASGTANEVLTAQHLADVYGVEVLRGDHPAPWIVPLRELPPDEPTP